MDGMQAKPDIPSLAQEEAPLLRLENIMKSFDGQLVLHGISLTVRKGEFLTLLGPSGCGKTTTLRIIAGLESPDMGRVFIRGKDVTALPPEKRTVNTVFQNYALFPHMTVEKNIGYGLRVRGVEKKEIDRRVRDMLDMMELSGFGGRMPNQLSGGQRQRVAIARAAILSPDALLLDEPLGALDLQLRRQMQRELKKMQRELGIAFVYITHDQEEALNMSDRVGLMRDGRIMQLDTPRLLYDAPDTTFAATFIGRSNVLRGVVAGVKENSGVRVAALECGGVTLPCPLRPEQKNVEAGDRMCLCVRVERLRVSAAPVPLSQNLSGLVRENDFVGGVQTVRVALPGGEEMVSSRQTETPEDLPVGSRAFLSWNGELAALTPDDEA